MEVLLYSLNSGLEQSITTQEKLLGVKDEKELGPILNEASKWAAQLDSTWKGIPQVLAILLHVLVDDKRTVDGKIGYLKVTRDQRAQILSALKVNFPALAEVESKAGQHALEFSICQFRQFLQDEWKSSDDQ
jgi:hypothetical protein